VFEDDMNKDEETRRAGLYIGSGLLGVIAANVLYGAAHGTTVEFGFDTRALTLNIVFALLGGTFAWRWTDILGRLAFVAFAVDQAMMGYAAATGARVSSTATTALVTAFAALLTASGARRSTRRRYFIAGGLFIAMLLASVGARYYADVLLSNHSVMGSGWLR
jgi:hypothetical protein